MNQYRAGGRPSKSALATEVAEMAGLALCKPVISTDGRSWGHRAGGRPGKSALAAKAAEMDALARRSVRTCATRLPLPGSGRGDGAPPTKWRRIVPHEQREQVRFVEL